MGERNGASVTALAMHGSIVAQALWSCDGVIKLCQDVLVWSGTNVSCNSPSKWRYHRSLRGCVIVPNHLPKTVAYHYNLPQRKRDQLFVPKS